MNKPLIYIKLLAVSIGLLIASGCSKSDFLDINTDPNSPTAVTSNQILPAAQVQMAFVMGNELQRIGAPLVQHYAGGNNQLLEYDTYDLAGDESDNSWAQIYATLKDLEQIVEMAGANGNHLYKGIAKLMQAYLFSQTTDIWGDIPFTNALKDIRNLKPTFDPQQEVYNGIFTMIDEAIADLNSPNPGANPFIATADRIYGGNPALWIKMGNTLKLKLLLQIRKRDAARATSGINALIAGNILISSNAEDFQLDFLSDNERTHPMYDFAYNRRAGDILMSERFIDSMQVLNDPRIPFYFDNNGQTDEEGNPDYIGYDNGGLTTPPLQAERARLGKYAVGTNGAAPQKFLTHFQTQFILAEAALTLGTTGNAREYYKNAMQASMNKVGVSETPANAYINQRLQAYDAAPTVDAKLRIIMRDKWVAQFGMGIEAWTDWRRTGYPRLRASTDNVTGDIFPRRLPYSINELTSNANAPAQVLSIIPVWWDVQ
jgi:hypothetical protein